MDKNQALDTLKLAIADCKHSKLGKLVERRISKSFPDCRVYVMVPKESWKSASIRVWYESNLYVELSLYLNFAGVVDLPTWQEKALKECEVQLTRDYEERLIMEGEFYPALQEIEDQIIALKTQALRIISSLPVPTSATIRKDPDMWGYPSPETRNKFPHTFE